MRRDRELRPRVDPAQVLRRPATPWDREFLEEAHVAALGPVALVADGWTAERLRAQFHREVRLDNCWVISAEGARAGYISVEDKRGHWYIDAFAILPKYQGRGVGEAALRNVQAEAAVIRLSVFLTNRARGLYERMGFRVISVDRGRQLMEWRATS